KPLTAVQFRSPPQGSKAAAGQFVLVAELLVDSGEPHTGRARSDPRRPNMVRRFLVVAGSIALILAVQPVATHAAGQASGITAIPVVTGLNFPAAFTITPDGRIFYGERLTG